ncbi:hypothetical protein ABK040_009538 [Willaertia magna]
MLRSAVEERIPLQIKNIFGVLTPRFCAGFCKDLNKFYAPIGPTICGWKENQRFLSFQAHSDVVTILEEHPKDKSIIISASYTGEIKLWKYNDDINLPFECIQSVKLKNSEHTMCGFWSMDGTKFIICSEGLIGTVALFEYSNNSLQLLDQIEGHFQMSCILKYENDYFIFSVEQVKQKKDLGVDISLYKLNNNNKLEKHQFFNLNDSGPLCTVIQRNVTDDLVAVSFQDRSIRLYQLFKNKSNEIELKEYCNFNAIGKGTIFVMKFNNNNDLYLHNCEKKTIDKYSFNNLENDNNRIAKLEKQFTIDNSGITLYYFEWIKEESLLWTYLDSEFNIVEYPTLTSSNLNLENNSEDNKTICLNKGKKINSNRYHDLTCCGIDFSPDGEFLVTGDFTGQIMLWKITKDNNNEEVEHDKLLSHEPILTSFVPASVRAICCKWHPHSFEVKEDEINSGNTNLKLKTRLLSVYIGSLDKNVHCWNINLDTMETITEPFGNIKFSLTSDITCLSWCNGKNPKLLACGSSNGMVCIMEDDVESSLMRIRLAIVAHQPNFLNKDLRFGSISKFSEIWSICFSPDNRFIATCSEDQTTRIFDFMGNQIHCLTGHTTAVTAVQWMFIKDVGEIIATCADDCSVMVWKLNSQFIDEEHHYHHYHQLHDTLQTIETYRDDHHLIKHSYNRWGLYALFKTNEYGLDWHTLTYMSIERKGTRIAASTQNGYLFVWDLKTKKLLQYGKEHLSSIEGMKWLTNKNCNMLATCGSDCTVNVYNMN